MVTDKRPLRDNKLKFYEKKHVYKVGRTKLDSVTEFVHSFFSKFDAKKKAKELAEVFKAKGIKAMSTQKYWLNSWKANAAHGTLVHRQVEDFILQLQDRTLVEAKTMQALAYLDVQQYHSLHPEVRIYSEDLRLAGTIDLIAIKGSEVTIVDWKTSKEIRTTEFVPNINPVTKGFADCNYTHYTLQLAVYAYILKKEYGMAIDRLHLVHLTEKKYVLYEIDYNDTLEKQVEKMLKASKRM